MSVSTVTKKGQTTVPKDVRDSLGIGPGGVLEWKKAGENTYIVVVVDRSVKKLKGMIKKPSTKVSIEDMRKAIREMGDG
ncbi:transcriptional regulator, AbrB family [Microbulbifer donghaiensis]|uniref:Transcriptional regulator, AbrB family n=1 Tax=Microbulbifer donghaiensis TaxID=494016 RepID=A0A1M4TX60_9GAMM|nr:AbrB/MazE/SpoVT family DNA-binding domain-containing protein [Microbulbifer donghaiensis]SHE49038.1 transcriptional regulator, AbrB family [Microbulbifer donghaiensis]